MSDGGLLVCAILRVSPDGLADFLAYEAAVLPLLADHGGVLERRLRTADRATEVHLIRFPSKAAMDAYRADPRRSAQAPLLARSGAASEVLEVTDVAAEGRGRPA